LDLRKVNKRVVESLVMCGAFDSMGYKRRALITSCEEIMELAQRRQREKSSGQFSIFDHLEKDEDADPNAAEKAILQDLPEWDAKELLTHEKETLGFYITGHPLSGYEDRLKRVTDTDAATIIDKKDEDEVRFAGVVSHIREATTKKKDLMAYVTIEDLKGSIQVVVFPEIYRKAYDLLHGEEPVLIKGAVDAGEESVKVIATEILSLSETLDHPFQTARFSFDAVRLADSDLDALRAVLKKFPGKAEGFLHLLDDSSETVIYLGKTVQFTPSERLKEEADRILGPGATRFV
jgi:DNA polymerase-3 subunit alpha